MTHPAREAGMDAPGLPGRSVGAALAAVSQMAAGALPERYKTLPPPAVRANRTGSAPGTRGRDTKGSRCRSVIPIRPKPGAQVPGDQSCPTVVGRQKLR
ncbi:MAG: hypothetical protein ACYDH5_11770 [Acidimicrobiales bacterium]